MRVLVVTPRYMPQMGGVENHVREVARRLHERADITVLTTDNTGRLEPTDSIDGVPVVRVPAYPRGRDYHIAPGLWSVITRGEWDLVHVQSYHTAVAPLAMIASLRARVPFVLTFHGGGHSSGIRTSARAVQQALLRPLLARARRLIAVAHFEARFFSEKLGIPYDRFVVIPNGSDLPAPSQDALASRTEGARVIASVGRLEKYKGHHRVVAALPDVVAAEPDVVLEIVGTGPYQAEIEALAARLGVADHVRVRSISPSDRQAMADALASYSLMVSMSDFETHPLAVVEALSAGCPVLVAGNSGLLEIAEDGLARALPTDASSATIAAAIVDELRHPEPARRVELPAWDACADAVFDVYRDAVGHRGSTTDSKDDAPVVTQGESTASPAAAKVEDLAAPPGKGGSRWMTAVGVAAPLGLLLIALANSLSFRGSSWGVPLFWIGLVLIFAPAAAALWSGKLSRQESIGILILTGLALYAVKVLHSPAGLGNFDELLHYRTLDDVAQSGRLFSENTLLPVSPFYPGLEIVTATVMKLTGLGILGAALTVIGVARLLMVLVVFLFLERVCKPPRLAGLGTLLYMACPSFVFFDAIFGYESLALPLAVFCLFAFRAGQLDEGGKRMALNLAGAAAGLAVVVTHHVTSFILAATLVLWAIGTWLFRRIDRVRAPGGGWGPALVLAAAVAWMATVSRVVVGYLWPHAVRAMTEMLRIVTGEATTRRLFESRAGISSPVLERIVGLGSVALIVACIPFGMWYLWKRQRTQSLAWLMALGAAAYPAMLLLRFTRSGWDIGSRAMAFIYIPSGSRAGQRHRAHPIGSLDAADACLGGRPPHRRGVRRRRHRGFGAEYPTPDAVPSGFRGGLDRRRDHRGGSVGARQPRSGQPARGGRNQREHHGQLWSSARGDLGRRGVDNRTVPVTRIRHSPTRTHQGGTHPIRRDR